MLRSLDVFKLCLHRTVSLLLQKKMITIFHFKLLMLTIASKISITTVEPRGATDGFNWKAEIWENERVIVLRCWFPRLIITY